MITFQENVTGVVLIVLPAILELVVKIVLQKSKAEVGSQPPKLHYLLVFPLSSIAKNVHNLKCVQLVLKLMELVQLATVISIHPPLLLIAVINLNNSFRKSNFSFNTIYTRLLPYEANGFTWT